MAGQGRPVPRQPAAPRSGGLDLRVDLTRHSYGNRVHAALYIPQTSLRTTLFALCLVVAIVAGGCTFDAGGTGAGSDTALAVVALDGSVELHSIDGAAVQLVGEIGPASANVTSVRYGSNVIAQLLNNGEVRVITRDGDNLTDDIVWQARNAPAQQAASIAVDDDRILFLVRNGVVRVTTADLAIAPDVLTTFEPPRPTRIAGSPRSLFLLSVEQVVEVVAPEVESPRRPAFLPGEARAQDVIAIDQRLLIALDNGSIIEFDHESGTTATIIEPVEAPNIGMVVRGSQEWFAVATPSGTALGNGVQTLQLDDLSPPVAAAGNTSQVAVLDQVGTVALVDPRAPSNPVIVAGPGDGRFSVGLLDG